MRHLWLLGMLALVLPLKGQAAVVWRGDFETGDRSQWTRAQEVSADRLQVVQSPVAQGRYALRATVQQGDDPIDSSGNRNELVRMTNEKEDDEYYYRWYTMFASDFPAPKTWQLFVQWHQKEGGGSPPVEFVVKDEKIQLSLDGATWVVWSMPMRRGEWLEFIFHVKWSSSAERGFVELYVDGELVLPRTPAATLHAGQTNYLKAGLYRNETIQPTGVVYHDGFLQATELADVMAPLPVPPPADAGTPPVVDAGTPPAPGPSDGGTPWPPVEEEPLPPAQEEPGEPLPPVLEEGGTDSPAQEPPPADGDAPEQPATQPGGPDEAVAPPGAPPPTGVALAGELGAGSGGAVEEVAQGCAAAPGLLGLWGLLALPLLARRRRRR